MYNMGPVKDIATLNFPAFALMFLLWEAKIGVYVLFNLSCPAVSPSRSSFVLLKYPEEISFRSSLLEAPKEAFRWGSELHQ